MAKYIRSMGDYYNTMVRSGTAGSYQLDPVANIQGLLGWHKKGQVLLPSQGYESAKLVRCEPTAKRSSLENFET